MENKDKKCSSIGHKESDAVSYCVECKIYMCNKCINFHSELFQNHHTYKFVKDINKIFTPFCKEKGHLDILEYFCKTHNKLCCSACLTKINKNGKGQHSACEVCILNEINEEKKNKLKENIKYLIDLSGKIESTIDELNKIIKTIDNDKEILKLEIQKIFTKIRNAINEREDEILSEIDKKFDDLFIEEKIVKKYEKLPSLIKSSLEKGNIMEKDWENENKLISIINDCIEIENIVNNINDINQNIKKCENSKFTKIKFETGNELENILKQLKTFGKIIDNKLILFYDSLILNNSIEYNNILKNWINRKIINIQLLYRKSNNDDSYETFHKLCDNKGPTLTLIKSSEGFIIGGYTPLDWDDHSYWKKDDDTFIFSLTNKRIFKKREKTCDSIYCDKNSGPWFPYIGCYSGKNMSQGYFYYNPNSEIEKSEEIIPNEKKKRYFDVEEVEVYQILFN